MTTPSIPNRFDVKFFSVDAESGASDIGLCGAAFSEVSGLEATMEPRAIREGGHYRGEYQRAGQVTYATVILKRGITSVSHLWTWFDLVGGNKTGLRLRAELTQLAGTETDGTFGLVPRFRWVMQNALPVKFKAATYNGTATDVGVEELHFVHEGLSLAPASGRASEGASA